MMMLSLIKLHLSIKVEKERLIDFDVAVHAQEIAGYEEKHIAEESDDVGGAADVEETSSDDDLPPSWLLPATGD